MKRKEYDTANEAADISALFDKAFATGISDGTSSIFAGTDIEVMKSKHLGKNGRIAIKTADLPRAVTALAKKGFEIDMQTAKYNGENMVAVYMKQPFGDFAVHLLQK